MSEPARLTLVTRAGCGLCQELAHDLSLLGVAFDSLDVDADDGLKQRYDEFVPVLLLPDGRELARAPFTQTSLKTALRNAGLTT